VIVVCVPLVPVVVVEDCVIEVLVAVAVIVVTVAVVVV
jgi:hypothetical protein